MSCFECEDSGPDYVCLFCKPLPVVAPCDVCKVKEATVFTTSVREGKLQKHDLCSGCSTIFSAEMDNDLELTREYILGRLHELYPARARFCISERFVRWAVGVVLIILSNLLLARLAMAWGVDAWKLIASGLIFCVGVAGVSVIRNRSENEPEDSGL